MYELIRTDHLLLLYPKLPLLPLELLKLELLLEFEELLAFVALPLFLKLEELTLLLLLL